MPRPTLPNDHRRTRQIIFRVTLAEFNRLARQAEAAGLRPNELARRAALAKGKRLVLHTHAINDPALLKRLERIGHNLNQLVKNAHIFGRVSPKVEGLCETIRALIEEAARGEWKR